LLGFEKQSSIAEYAGNCRRVHKVRAHWGWASHRRVAGGFFIGELMGGRAFIFVVAAFLLSGIGCERRAVRVALPNMVIPVGCASEITLLQCDARVTPPKCRSARVKYRNGCEQIVVVGNERLRGNE